MSVQGVQRSATPSWDHPNLNKTNGIDDTAGTNLTASKASLELVKLDQYREGEFRELDPLLVLFRNHAVRFLPNVIPKKFAVRQLEHLNENYPGFASKLLSEEALALGFFRFCLQALSQSSHRGTDVSHWVDLYVKHPEMAEKLMKSSLCEKLGRFPENVDVDSEKGVRIKLDLFDQNADLVPINPTTDYSFKNKGGDTEGIRLSWKQIFEQFENSAIPDLDVASEGVRNFNSLLLESKDSKGKSHPVVPEKWIEYLPSVELYFCEMKKLFPAALSETPFTFVLRMISSEDSASQTFFDFIMKLPNGNFRVISLQRHQKPSPGVQHQKSYFYPLTQKQGDRVIGKVAKEFGRFRLAYAEGKPIPPIDTQTYLDDLLSHDYFYDHLEELVSKMTPERSVQWTQVRQNLDTAAFVEFLRPVIDKLMDTRDMKLITTFINTSLTTINSVLQTDAAKTLPPVKVEEVTEAAKALGNNNLGKMGPSLLALASLCFDVLHPYRVSIADAEKDTPVIGFIFRKIESIPWVWLKNLLYNFLLTILGPFRGYHYQTMETAHLKPLPMLAASIRNLVPERYINRPSQSFEGLSDKRKQDIEAIIQEHLKVLTSPAA